MKVVIDTNVIIAGLYSRSGASFRIIEAAMLKRLHYSVSPLVVLEYIGKIVDKKREGLLELPLNDYMKIIKVLIQNGHLVTDPVLNRPTLPDNTDDKILECALAGQCNCILTFNKRDFPLNIIKQYDISVLTPGEYIKIGGLE